MKVYVQLLKRIAYIAFLFRNVVNIQYYIHFKDERKNIFTQWEAWSMYLHIEIPNCSHNRTYLKR